MINRPNSSFFRTFILDKNEHVSPHSYSGATHGAMVITILECKSSELNLMIGTPHI